MEFLGLLISFFLAMASFAQPANINGSFEDAVRCVAMHEQPAFDNPLLRNHVIQERPSEIPKPIGAVQKSKWETHEAQVSTVPCPKGTVPISFADDPISRPTERPRANSTGHEYATMFTTQKLYGAKATVNVWNPALESEAKEMSISQIWITSGEYKSDDLNTIEVGWQVLPELYKDNKTRLFLFWTSNTYKTGCYNVRCPGFIQTSSRIVIGGAISPISSLGGSQFEITIHVWKDRKSGNWWLSLGPNSELVGYWPSEIFTTLADHAEKVSLGGEIFNSQSFSRHTRTEMGSGHFPYEGFGKSSYFRNLEVVDSHNSLQSMQNLKAISTSPKNYDVTYLYTDEWKSHFFYGGPGFRSGAVPSALPSFFCIFLILFVIV